MVSHYEVLGIRETADRRAVRAAYLQRIKAIHPDRAGKSAASKSAAGTRNADGGSATEVNLAYFTLRDPRRRLAHDLELKQARNGGGLVPAERRDLAVRRGAGPPPPPPPRSKSAVASGGLLSVAIIALGLLIADLSYKVQAPARAARAAAENAAAPARPISPFVDRAMVDEAVALLMEYRAYGRSAVSYSNRCFGLLETNPSALLLDHCLAFDLAAARWGRPADAAAEPAFAAPVMAGRHRAALSRFDVGEGGSERMRELSVATSAAIARRLSPGSGSVPEPARDLPVDAFSEAPVASR